MGLTRAPKTVSVMATCGCSLRMPSEAITAPSTGTSGDRMATRGHRGPFGAGSGGSWLEGLPVFVDSGPGPPGRDAAHQRSIAAATPAAQGSAGHRRRKSHKTASETAPQPSHGPGGDSKA